jgi:hypothetical protein
MAQRLGGILASHVKTQAGRTRLLAKVLTAGAFLSGRTRLLAKILTADAFVSGDESLYATSESIVSHPIFGINLSVVISRPGGHSA